CVLTILPPVTALAVGLPAQRAMRSDLVLWHVSDVPILPTKVGYEWQSGSEGDIVKPTRLNPEQTSRLANH
ncbi:MAG TPA: hypothetical protein VK620_24150, partial [Bradyrhizobium sp.]|nr:hypothetical protein [Bradyrhizobium sp.]